VTDEPTVITGEENIRAAQLLAQRIALAAEVRGMKRRGRSMRTIANELMGTHIKTVRATYDAFDTWCTENYGLPPRPLPKEKK
jgi:hypothetical protein